MNTGIYRYFLFDACLNHFVHSFSHAKRINFFFIDKLYCRAAFVALDGVSSIVHALSGKANFQLQVTTFTFIFTVTIHSFLMENFSISWCLPSGV